MDELMLITPTLEYGKAIMEYKKEFLNVNSPLNGCGALRRVETPEDFISEVQSDLRRETLKEGRVCATLLLCVRKQDNKIVGMIQIRHYLNEYLEQFGGHIGYSVRPTERGNGYAKHMLKLALPICKKLGIEKVLITCDEINRASEKTILANGGIYDSTVFSKVEEEYLKRYWINL